MDVEDFRFRSLMSAAIVLHYISIRGDKISRRHIPRRLKRDLVVLWRCRLDDTYCCSGHHCGCMGVTWRQYWKERMLP